MLLQRRREAKHRTESIEENQALEIPSVDDRFVVSIVTKFYNHQYGEVHSTMMLVLIMPCKSLKCFSHANSSLIVVNPSLLKQKNS